VLLNILQQRENLDGRPYIAWWLWTSFLVE